MDDYIDLIARLEKATAPTRPLFEESYLAAHGKPCWDDGDDGYFFNECLGIGAWESAALVLVPEGWLWTASTYWNEYDAKPPFFGEVMPPWVKDPDDPRELPDTQSWAQAAALALVIAALKARQAGG